jgi:hypothetical protein
MWRDEKGKIFTIFTDCTIGTGDFEASEASDFPLDIGI